MPKFPFELKVTSGLIVAVWSSIFELKRVYETEGVEAYSKLIEDLTIFDPVRAVRAMGAFFPDDVRETLKDVMAERGMTREDLEEIIKKARGRNRPQ